MGHTCFTFQTAFMRVKLSTAVLLLLLSASLVHAQTKYFPGVAWQKKNPAELKMNAAIVDSAVHFAVANDSKTDRDLRIADLKAFGYEPDFRILGPMKDRGNPSGLIIKDGFIVAQWGEPDRVDMTFSVTKSYLSTVAGLALDKGLIKDLDEPVKNYVWDGKFEGAHNSKITWRHLLTQSSDWSGCLFDICDWADRPQPRNGDLDEWKNRKLNEPGSFFKYNDVRVNLLAYSLLQVWRTPLPQVLKENIMDPIGASPTWRWYGYDNSFVNVDGLMMQSVSGGGHFGGGLFINTYDQARFGLLFARRGQWKERQLISSNWTEAVHTSSAANASYGLMWWTNAEGRLGKVSKNIYAAEGFGGNFIVVDAEHDLVMAVRWLEPAMLKRFVELVESSLP